MKKFLILIFVFFIISCSSKKQIYYFQDFEKKLELPSQAPEYLINEGDVLKISIQTESPENFVILNQDFSNANYMQSRESLTFNGYAVSQSGHIDYPQIGKIKLIGKTIEQAKSILYEKFSELEILADPIIDIKILNLNFTILGEVNSPGKFFYNEPNFNLIQAIGLAGDLTINGNRKDIRLIRFKDDKQYRFSVDLTSSSFLSSDAFHINSGDIIIINPNSSRVKNAGIIGNAGNLLSLLSFLLSSIILISSQ